LPEKIYKNYRFYTKILKQYSHLNILLYSVILRICINSAHSRTRKMRNVVNNFDYYNFCHHSAPLTLVCYDLIESFEREKRDNLEWSLHLLCTRVCAEDLSNPQLEISGY
jgi:hypothetical protein